MKRMLMSNDYIQSASLNELTRKIELGLNDAGCSNIKQLNRTNQFIQYKFKLPNGKLTSAKFWYSYRIHNEPNPDATKRIKWDSTMRLDTETGKVYIEDEEGNTIYLGEAFVVTRNPKGIKKTKDFLENSISSNSGDIEIRELTNQLQFDRFVEALQYRKVTYDK